VTTPDTSNQLRATLDRYNQRVAEIAETRRGAPRPDILRELIEATAEFSGCIPIRHLEVLARRISDGEDIDDPAEEDHIA
jgi:hypothetical protein